MRLLKAAAWRSGSAAPLQRCSYVWRWRTSNGIAAGAASRIVRPSVPHALIRFGGLRISRSPPGASPGVNEQQAAPDESDLPPLTLVRFRTRRKLGPLQFLKICGNDQALGRWDRGSAPRMIPYGEDVWELDSMLGAGSEVEFLCTMHGPDQEHESEGESRRVEIPEGCNRVEVEFEFGSPNGVKVEAFLEDGSLVGADTDEVRAPLDERKIVWQGREIRFMSSNDHPRERTGVWKSQGLDGVARKLVEVDKDAGSWLEKLRLVKSVLVDDAFEMRPDEEALAYTYIYTSWMNQGILPCVESGGHRRPHHHAELARDIFRSLEWVNGPDMRGTSLSKVARWLQTQIPSLSAEFRRSEPLTRIRDIAHRNDIPQDLKREIKHTLQNKLHRNAGPEDLVAAELMYDRIRKDEADLSEAFVCEFGVFLDELRDFFNAGNLSDSLQSIAQSLGGADDVGVQNIQQFLAGKKKLDMFRPNKAKPGEEITLVMDALHAVTTVRAYLTTRLSSGLRNDAPDAALAMRQTYRIAELRCEDYAFVLLGRFIGLTEERTSPSDLASAPDNSWALPIGALILGLRHLGMGGWEDMECFAIENELAMWHKLGRISVAENALRMKATLERLQRLISKISQDVVGLFAGRAGALGDALGVEPFMIQVFAESQIRASVLYQVSNLCTFLQHASREASGAGAWDAIVPGTATGRLMELERLDKGEIPVSTADHPLVLLIRSADGYEDVSGLTTARNGDSKKGGVSVSGIVLCQELPHLSHLGVRASQEHLVFASCIDETLLENEVKPLVGELVRLQVDSEGVTISEWRKDVSNGSQEPQPDNSSAAALNLQVSVDAYNAVATEDEMPSSVDRPDMQASVMRLAEATVHSCGAKASNCGILERLSMAKGAFHVPKGVCLPFEAMQLCLGADKSAHLDRLLKSLESEPALETVVGEIQRIIDECLPSDDILESIGKVFRAGTCVIVRSSSNMEDILGMTGAGLHDSIQNIDPSNPKTLSKAISDVWASLHTLRAVQARRAAGIPHSSAKMGVIIQEQLYPNMSFVLHTTEPVSRDASIIAAEMAPGLGETLASGVRGTPWRLAIGKATGSVVVKAFANFSHELQPQGMPGRGWESVGGADVGLVGRVVDYSRCSMSVDEERRAYVGRKLAEVSKVLEDNFGGQAQDVEGALNEDGTVYIVQTRPQPL